MLELIIVKCAVLGVLSAMWDISKWSLDQDLFITWIWSLNSQGVVWPFFGIWAPVGPYLYPTPHATNRNSPTQSFINNSPPCHGFFAMAGVFLRYNVYIYMHMCLAADRQFCFENFLEKIFESGFGNGTIGFARVQTIDLNIQQKKINFWWFLTEPLIWSKLYGIILYGYKLWNI